MDVKKKQIDLYSDKPVVLISLCNDNDAVVNILNYGATVRDILLPGLTERIPNNMILSFETVEEYVADPHYIGGLVGRYANRIAGGRLPIENEVYQLTINEPANQNHLHGGNVGFNKRLWQVKSTQINESDCGVTLSVTSNHMDEGYPGNLKVEVTYVLSNANELFIQYKATTDRPTVVNLTNHCYFNLSGGKSDISGHLLSIYADEYTPADERYIPLGTTLAVDHSIYDLRMPQQVSRFMNEIDTLNYVLKNNKEFKPAARLTDPESGRTMEVKTTCPGLQLYCGNYLEGKYWPFSGICLEPDYYPDSPNHPQFPSTLLLPNEEYYEVTSYKFG